MNILDAVILYRPVILSDYLTKGSGRFFGDREASLRLLPSEADAILRSRRRHGDGDTTIQADVVFHGDCNRLLRGLTLTIPGSTKCWPGVYPLIRKAMLRRPPAQWTAIEKERWAGLSHRWRLL